MRNIINGLIAVSLLAIVSTGCSDSKKEAAKGEIPETALGLRKTDINTEKTTMASKTEYTGAAPGTSEKYERAYTDAPPMIPHSVEGLIPIERDNNQCTGCHMPYVAEAVGATPIPKSHFVNFRPKSGCLDGKFKSEADVMKNKTFAKELKDALYKGRYNCTQCHAPQSQGNLAVENTFTPDFKDESEKSKSHLLDTLNEGVDIE